MKLKTRVDFIVSAHLRGIRLSYWVGAAPNLKEDWVIDGDPVKKAAVEANDEAVMVEVSTEPPPKGESVAEADMGQRWPPEVWGQREAGLRGPASYNEAYAFIQMIKPITDTFKNL